MKLNLTRMIDEEEAKKIYSYLRREENIVDISNRLGISIDEVHGLIELLNHFDFPITIEEINGDFIAKKHRKQMASKHKKVKIPMDECTKTTIGLVGDTHLCSKDQQLHMLNTAYRYFYENEIDRVLHLGDLVDGDYGEKRKSQLYNRFMHGADEQSDYVIEMYPYVEGIHTDFIQGSHDETHKINGGATLGRMISNGRNDMTYRGQDHADVVINGVKMRMRHPGGGVSKYRSRSVQTTIDAMSSGNKPKALYEGHYHKSYYVEYRNIHAILCPALCYQSQFMERKDVSNIMGFYDVDIYSDEKGDIQYFVPREHLFDESQIRKDDFRKTKRLVIRH